MPLPWNLIASYNSWLILGADKGLEMIKIPFVWNNFGSIEFIASQGRFSKPGLSWLNSLTHVFFLNNSLHAIPGARPRRQFVKKNGRFLSWKNTSNRKLPGCCWTVDMHKEEPFDRLIGAGQIHPLEKMSVFFSTGNTCRCHGWNLCSMLVCHSLVGGFE